MKIDSIIQEPFRMMEEALTQMMSERAAIQGDIVISQERIVRLDAAIAGYRHVLVLLQDESNKI